MKLDTNIYQELIHSIDIKEINLKNLSVDKSSNTHNKNIEISVKHEVSSFKRESDLFEVLTSFAVTGATDGQSLFVISFNLELNYTIDSQLNFEDQYFEYFAQNNVPVNAWPYARELVSNLTIRMGLSPLILPVLRV